MRIALSALSEFASMSQEGTLTVGGIFELLLAKELPAVIAKIVFVCVIHSDEVEAGTHTLTLEVKNDSEMVIDPLPIEITLLPRGRYEQIRVVTNHLIATLGNVTLKNEGLYHVSLREGAVELCDQTFHVLRM